MDREARRNGPWTLPEIESPDSLDPETASLWLSTIASFDWPDDLRRTSFWALRLMREVAVRSYWRLVPGYRFVAFGFLDPLQEADDFGVVVFAVPDPFGGPPHLDDIVLGGRAFPVYVRRVVETPHAPTIFPGGGSTGCWARSRVTSQPRGPGILTAKHVVTASIGLSYGAGLNSSIALTNGMMGQVIDVAPEGIDAAIVLTGEAPGKVRLTATALVAPWSGVEFVGAASGAHQTWVTLVTDTRGIFNSTVLPARIMLAGYGRGGDSGALVHDLTTRDPATGQNLAVGIYIGAVTDQAGHTEGVAQHAFQAMQLMDMELYL